MFCVIQEIQRKKPNRYGGYRELEAYQESWTVGDKPAKWSYRYTGERFERPHKEAYKLTLHQSYREGGKVRKKQYSIATIGYYDAVEFSLYDCADTRIVNLSKTLNIEPAELYHLIESKFTPLVERLEAEFRQSEEYRTHQGHRQIIDKHQKARAAFGRTYDVDADEYDRCYDVFGQLRNEAYLKTVIRQYKKSRSYQKYSYSNYNFGGSGSYGVSLPSTYTEAETAILKQFYRALSKTYHPDLNPGTDTTAQMQLLNKLKESWGV